MTKLTNTALKPGNGKPSAEEMTIVKAILNPAESKTEEKKPVLQIEPEKLVVPAPEPKKEMTMLEKILKIENLQLVIEKRAKLVQTRSELDRFQISSNDFNCTMRLNDSDGNVFTTSFTPGIKKVIEFLKTSFDASITEAENKITFWIFSLRQDSGVPALAGTPFFMIVITEFSTDYFILQVFTLFSLVRIV